MKAVKLAAGLLLILGLVSGSLAILQINDLIYVEAHQAVRQLNARGIFRGIYPVSDEFLIAETKDIEPFSAVAYGGGRHVVVYVKENIEEIESIYATVVSDGETGQLEVYPVSNQTVDCGQPAIAYQANKGLFIILYACEQKDIFAQVFSPANGFIRPAHLVSEGEEDKGYPAIACNQHDGICLVAYLQNGENIKGRYIEVTGDGIGALSEFYQLAEGDQVGQPLLAWGRDEGTFLLTYHERLASGEVRPAYTHVYDQYDPLAAEMLLHPSTPLLPGGLFSPGHDAFISDITFDPCTEKFILTIDYDAVGEGHNFDLWATVVDARDPVVDEVFPIADSPVSEHGGAIRFVTADHGLPACGGMDRLVVAYINAEVGLMAAELRGNSNPTDASYTVDPVDQHLLIKNHPNMFRITDSNLSSSVEGNRVLIVYEFQGTGSSEYLLFGRFLSFKTSVYLPLVIK